MMRSAMVAALLGAAGGVCGQSWREIDGTGNNLANPSWGITGAFMQREASGAHYADGIGAPITGRPSPRAISNAVGQQTGSGNSLGISGMFWQWGQFIDHDFNLIREDASSNLPISIPAGDPWFDPSGTGTQVMNMHRSQFAEGVTTPRQFSNAITHFLDGSVVYGSDATRAADLRDGSGGRLRMSAGGLLPFNTGGLENAGGTGPELFISGDIRANEQIGLTSMHTLFMREHNRVADQLASSNPSWDDERLYQTARKIVGAKIQKITYDDWLPTFLGDGAMPEYAGYDAGTNPELSLAFSTAAYRFGHSMLNAELPLVGPNGRDNGSMSLADSFFNPGAFADPSLVSQSLKGLTTIEANTVDTRVIDEVRNFLFGPPGSGGLDLLSLNLNRGRDHGIADYNTLRVDFGLAPVVSFSDITSDVTLQTELAALYGDVNNIDAWIGMAAEDHVSGAAVGETLMTIFVDQFGRMRDGDRYFYENDADLLPYLGEISSHTLGDLMELNLGIAATQANVFLVPAPSGLALLGAGAVLVRRRRA